MKLCDDEHDEVCYNGRNCPVCEKMKEIEVLEEKICELEQELKDAE